MKKRLHRLDYYALKPIFERPGLSSPEVAEGCRVPFENFRKREKQWLKRLEGLVTRTKVTKGFQWHPANAKMTLEQARRKWQNANPNK